MAQKNKQFRALIYANYDTEAQLADDLGWPRQKLNRMTNGMAMPNISELNDLAQKLNVDIGQIARIFLHNKSQNCDFEGEQGKVG